MAKSARTRKSSQAETGKIPGEKTVAGKRSASPPEPAARRVRSLLQPEIPNSRKSTKEKSAASEKTAVQSKSAVPPQPAADAELIVRQGFIIDATGGSRTAIPEVLILGNEAGLRYLADLCGHLAGRADESDPSAEPADAFHLGRLGHPINARLSDALEFSLALLTAANRAATFKRHGITMKSREHGSLFGRYQEAAQAESRKAEKQATEPTQLQGRPAAAWPQGRPTGGKSAWYSVQHHWRATFDVENPGLPHVDGRLLQDLQKAGLETSKFSMIWHGKSQRPSSFLHATACPTSRRLERTKESIRLLTTRGSSACIAKD